MLLDRLDSSGLRRGGEVAESYLALRKRIATDQGDSLALRTSFNISNDGDFAGVASAPVSQRESLLLNRMWLRPFQRTHRWHSRDRSISAITLRAQFSQHHSRRRWRKRRGALELEVDAAADWIALLNRATPAKPSARSVRLRQLSRAIPAPD